MNTRVSKLFLGFACAACLIPAARAQTFTNLYSFTGGNGGSRPWAGLVLAGGTLYGTASEAGNDNGTVFSLNTNGSGFATLVAFGGPTYGVGPFGGLILVSNTLFGTTYKQGDFGEGSVFAVNTDGSGFAYLHSFTPIGYGGVNSDGAYPWAGLILPGNTQAPPVVIDGGSNGLGNTMYGTTYYGGSNGNGTVFAINTDGTGFATLYTFSAGSGYNNGGNYINSDGGNPEAGLIISGNTLYGTTHYGGISGNGAVFAVNTDGTGFANLHSFSEMHGNLNSDGAVLNAGLVLAGNTLYGTTSTGGSLGNGTVFAVNTDGSGFASLHSFTGASDGNSPQAGLMISGNILYGTAYSGGKWDEGTVFALNTNGAYFTNLHSFTSLQNVSNGDGANPQAGLILAGTTLYGTTSYGGTAGYGTVFALNLAASLSIYPTNNQIVLSWPAWAPGFGLQCSTNLGAAAWCAVTSAPVLVNRQNVVTVSISGAQQHFRLTLP